MKQLITAAMLCLSPYAWTDTLTIYNWEDYLSPAVVQAWEQQTGHTIKQVYYDSDETRDEVMGLDSGQTFDIVLFDNYSVQLFGKNDRLVAVSPTQLPSLKYIAPDRQESCGNFGLPYVWGTLGIVYNKQKVQPPPASWADLLMPDKAHHGHIVMLEDSVDTLLPALLYQGHSLNSEDQQELQEAFKLLQSQSGKVLKYGYHLAFAEESGVSDTLHMALGYSGDQYSLNDAQGRDDWDYVIPREGTVIWVDCMAVMAKSANKALAFSFLEFINQPERAALTSEDLGVATANQAAIAYLPKLLVQDKTVYPDAKTLANSHYYRILSDENMTLRSRIVAAIIKQHDSEQAR